jgi:hypothetical protein
MTYSKRHVLEQQAGANPHERNLPDLHSVEPKMSAPYNRILHVISSVCSQNAVHAAGEETLPFLLRFVAQ